MGALSGPACFPALVIVSGYRLSLVDLLSPTFERSVASSAGA